MLKEGTLKDKVAIVTGGGTGLGKVIAHELSRLGAKVVVASRKMENLETVVKEIKEKGGDALAVTVDVREPLQVEDMVKKTKEKFGAVHILINNAAGNFICPTVNLSYNGWNAVVGIVLNGTFYCTKAVCQDMINQNYGRIVNIIATYAWHGAPGVVHSAAAKAGVLALTQSLAVEWAPFNIRVNAIAPGVIYTEGASKQLFPTKEVQDMLIKQIPGKKMGKPEDIAWATAYLVSDYSDFVNGECMTVDGGTWLGKGILAE